MTAGPADRDHSWPVAHRRALVLAALALVAYLSALNRVQTLPWVIAALLSATLVVGVLWPHWLVRRLSVIRHGPEQAQEGETIRFHVEVANQGWLPRFMVELVDHLPFAGAAAGMPAPAETVLGAIAHVPGGARRRFDVPVVCEKRGHYRLGPLRLASSFPLGLAEARRDGNWGVQTLTVYPQVFPISALPLRGAPSQIHRGGYLLPEGAGAAEFSGLREYRRGDNPRHIHWPTTARLNTLIVREFEPLASACLCLALDQSADGNVGAGRHATFEYAARIAASIARYACEHGLRVRLAGAGARPLDLPPGTGDGHYRDMLDALARVEADGHAAYAGLLTRLGERCARGETLVAFLEQPEERVEETLQALAALRARGLHLVAVVFDRESFARPLAGDGDSAGTTRIVSLLQDLGAHCVTVRRDDDLLRLFNP